MYSMKQACEKTGLTYETLKFYCNQGLVPNLKRDELNRRVFDDMDISWINSLNCLRGCNMGIQEMRHYIDLVLAGNDTIPERRVILQEKQKALREELKRIQSAIDYIDWKQRFYDDIEAGRIPPHARSGQIKQSHRCGSHRWLFRPLSGRTEDPLQSH